MEAVYTLRIGVLTKGRRLPETVSMNFIMAGMLPTVIILKHYYPQASTPLTLDFFFVCGGGMSAATIIGFAFAYPINSCLVKQGIEHGMMFVKGKGVGNKMEAIAPNENLHHKEHKPVHYWPVAMGSFLFFIFVIYMSSYIAPIDFWSQVEVDA